jgi:hypothetical protein
MWKAILLCEAAVVVGVVVFLFGAEGMAKIVAEAWRLLW